MRKIEVPEMQNGNKATKCIGEMLPNLKQSEIKRILKKGDVKLNGKRIRKDTEVCAGDMMDVYIPGNLQPLPELDIAYEDENIIVVNKMPGFSVVSDKKDGKPTLLDLVEEYMKKQGKYIPESGNIPFACHRLDHNTGGLTIFTKNGELYDEVCEAMNQRRIVKFYTAILVGNPRLPEAELTGFLRKDAGASKVKIVKDYGKNTLPIVTRYKVSEAKRNICKAEIELVTGRTHQIRAHMASIGNPVLGDDKYGDRAVNKKYGLKYQALWATRLVFHTGANNPLAYLNGKVINAVKVMLPNLDFED